MEISDFHYLVTQSNLKKCRTMKTAISQRHKTNYHTQCNCCKCKQLT